LDTAKRYLKSILENMQPVIEAGVPVVGLEPSCVAVFRDEMLGLFPENQDAIRLQDKTFLLSEFLMKHADGWSPPHIGGKALVHIHCHHKSVLGKEAELELLKKMGIEAEQPEPGCCGLAGSFGFEAGKYGVSQAIGEQRLLPAVRKADGEKLLIADGFSCETQIEQGSGRKPMHIAEVIASALPKDTASLAPRKTHRLLKVGAAGAAGIGALVASRLLLRALRPRPSGVRHEVQTAR
ncbi:MAG TPA: hypothetical protein VGI99_09105, partial [Gemmataceae bacterium]